ncbi:MAG: hypothetical protein IPF68_06510 [Bacteroidales bacterium]|nr:hypothetical protein [Bacteroidales bacterium]
MKNSMAFYDKVANMYELQGIPHSLNSLLSCGLVPFDFKTPVIAYDSGSDVWFVRSTLPDCVFIGQDSDSNAGLQMVFFYIYIVYLPEIFSGMFEFAVVQDKLSHDKNLNIRRNT